MQVPGSMESSDSSGTKGEAHDGPPRGWRFGFHRHLVGGIGSAGIILIVLAFSDISHVQFGGVRLVEAKQKAPNYYDILGLTKKATLAEIKKTYRKLSKQYHPDVNKGDKSSQEKFTRVAEAYEVLSSSEERGKYDRLGPEEYQNQKDGRGGGDEFWGDFPFPFFGGGPRKRGREKSPSLKMRLHVTLQQLYFGDLLHVTFRRPVLCMHVEDCLTNRRDCAGEGMKVVQQQVGPGFVVQNHVPDDACVSQGKGWKAKCSKCPNGSSEMEKTFLSAYVEPGARSGEKLEFHGIGWQMLGHDAGDLILAIVELPNQLKLDRRGEHLHTEIFVTLLEALVGFEKQIPHISGKEVTVSRKIVTADGEVEVLKGKGMPVYGAENKYGDMFVKLRVQFPVELNVDQRAKVREALEPVTNWKHTVDKSR